MATSDNPPRYRSFLLTAWAERNQDSALPRAWRFGLEDVHAIGRRRVFATVEALVLFLQKELAREEGNEE